MFSYQQISRWLSFPTDPITIEDWLANREIFGVIEEPTRENDQLELAYSTEKARAKSLDGGPKDWPLSVLLNGAEVVGVVDEKDYLLVVPVGLPRGGGSVLDVELVLGGEKAYKVSLAKVDFLVVPVGEEQSVKLKASARGGLSFGKSATITWVGSGKRKLVFDTRGRPIVFLDGQMQRELMGKMYQQLG